MLAHKRIFGSFSTDDIQKAKTFYSEVLGMNVSESSEMNILQINTAMGIQTIIYPKPGHKPADFTVLNIVVADIDKAVDELSAKGVVFEQYEGDIKTDKKGISRGMGPSIAWFKDPAGNILSVIEDNSQP